MWPEVENVRTENKRELNLVGSSVSQRIEENGLDEAIFDINTLNLLHISETTLATIPADIEKLTNLQSLLLFGNKIPAIPSCIVKLDKLKVLDLSRNQITDVPTEIGELINLTTINLSNNAFESFPSLRNNAKLSVLNLSNNQLREFPDVCDESMSNLSEINFKSNLIETIPETIANLPALKVLNLTTNKIRVVSKTVAAIPKLKELMLGENPVADKRLLKLIEQCRTKQIVDYVKQHGAVVARPVSDGDSLDSAKSGKGKGKSSKNNIEAPKYFINVQKHTEASLKVVFTEEALSVRPFILCCLVHGLDLSEAALKKFLQLQTKLHETVCEKREASTIATHNLAAVRADLLYTAQSPRSLKITPLGRTTPISGQKMYENLKAEADALRKEKKRNVYTGLYKYLYLLDNKETFACLKDAEGTVISLPPLTNSDITKMSTATQNILIEVTSSSSMTACRKTIDMVISEMTKAGLSVEPNRLQVQQVKIVDPDGNLKTVYPSKTDLDLGSEFLIERE